LESPSFDFRNLKVYPGGVTPPWGEKRQAEKELKQQVTIKQLGKDEDTKTPEKPDANMEDQSKKPPFQLPPPPPLLPLGVQDLAMHNTVKEMLIRQVDANGTLRGPL